MVKITNGIETFEVTKGAFDGIYSRQGYRLCEVIAEVVEQVPEVSIDAAEDGDVAFCTSIEEKPISQWSKAEIKRYASVKGIDISATKNAGEAKELIKEYIATASEEPAAE